MPDTTKRQERIEELRAMLPPGTIIYTALSHVSQTGMTRSISLHTIDRETHPLRRIPYLADVMGWKFGPKHDGWKISGAGMDMGFELVYDLSRAIYHEGFTPADAGRAFGLNGTPAEEHKPDGGYALTHKWI